MRPSPRLGVEGVGEDFERLVDVAALQRAHLAEFKTDAHREGLSILRRHLQFGLSVDLVSDDDTRQLLPLVLLLDARVPVLEQAERFLIRGIVNQHHLVCLAKQVKSDVLEDVLSGDVDHVELAEGVRLALDGHFLEGVLAALRHHVVVIELLFDVLVDDLRLAHARLSCHYDSR
eukprot:CAMPEP_0185579530 /NCGR_PEP_ID=MMETSP0434-20130131/15114_1 /TAXON_ID=626734 ORGANISM="Favella taraikaensis, Strain Fe Narragansett Bay" /NCGR_SAMPLE_ID=MMETSP0434 /ASSEMBLY_ACC=CAM_ASM_000379 /LENGTH=174 /DNA_ID=CAMNT_0028197571 /DNA_START=206 /DNA_END=727 /DNA_ORIENTATION=-